MPRILNPNSLEKPVDYTFNVLPDPQEVEPTKYFTPQTITRFNPEVQNDFLYQTLLLEQLQIQTIIVLHQTQFLINNSMQTYCTFFRKVLEQVCSIHL